MIDIIACTDGSAVIKGPMKGCGGIGIYLRIDDQKFYLSKGFSNTKTGRMEITALWYALSFISDHINSSKRYNIDIHCDSEYVIKSFTENRLNRWIENDWINTSGEVVNKDLWIKVKGLIDSIPQAKLTFHHIKGHQLDKIKDKALALELLKREEIRGNWIADKLADYRDHDHYEVDVP